MKATVAIFIALGCLFQVGFWIFAFLIMFGTLIGDCLHPEECNGKNVWLFGELIIAGLISGAAAVGTRSVVRFFNGA